MKPALGIVADDFTGAVMVASYLESAGVHCPVVFDPAAIPSGAPVIMVAARTRTVPVADALAELTRIVDALESIRCVRVAYKACATFDSTAEGNIGPAADFLADRYEQRPVLMSAGFPRFNTTVHQGYLFYRGRLVSESIKRFDPLTPMSDPDLVRSLSRQTPHRIGLLDHATLRQGSDAAAHSLDQLSAEGFGHVFLDATDDGDVEVSAELATARHCVVAASDPLIIAYAIRLARAEPVLPPALPRHAEGPAAVLVGSVGPVATAQLTAFGAVHPVLTLDLLDPRGEDAVVEAAVDWASGHIGTRSFAISTAADPAGVERTQAALGMLGAARSAEQLLGRVSRGLRERGVRRFVVAGGETSGAIVGALNIGRARALPEGKCGTGFCVTEDAEPLSLYLKPGKLGADDILLQAIAAMQDDRRG